MEHGAAGQEAQILNPLSYATLHQNNWSPKAQNKVFHHTQRG